MVGRTPTLFQKKPLIVEAMRFTDVADGIDIIGWVERRGGQCVDSSDALLRVYIEVEHQWVDVREGDWLIRGVAGEFYPCAPDVFEATYDALPERY